MKLKYQFVFDHNETLIKEFENEAEYLAFVQIQGPEIKALNRLDFIDEMWHPAGTLLNE